MNDFDSEFVVVGVEAKASRPAYRLVVGIEGLYTRNKKSDKEDKEDQRVDSDSILIRATQDQQNRFALRAIRELMPFLRSEIYSLSRRMPGDPGVMLKISAKISVTNLERL